jgi:Leucine-rich repeat (LRR) protein
MVVKMEGTMSFNLGMWLALLLAGSASAMNQEEELLVNPIEKLPTEIKRLCTSFLPNQDLLNLRGVSKYWKQIAEDVLEKEDRTLTINLTKIPDVSVGQREVKIRGLADLKIRSFHFIGFVEKYRENFFNFTTIITHPDLVKKVSFSNNRLGKIRLGVILPLLEKFKNVECLDFSFNHITSRTLEKMPKYLILCPHLKFLNLNNNLINDLTVNPWVEYLEKTKGLLKVGCLKQSVKKGKKNHYEDLLLLKIPEGVAYSKMS